MKTAEARANARAYPLVEVARGDLLEAVHSVAAQIVTADGDVVYTLGAVSESYPARSLAKPFVAAELVRSGAADAYGFSSSEIALASASHDGEPQHIAGVASMLRKAGLDESDLRCGPAMVGNLEVGPPIANNCSGKHAAVLALCRHLALPTQDYLTPNHPVQQKLSKAVLAWFGLSSHRVKFVIDGCGMPIFGATLSQIALAYARMGAEQDPAMYRVLLAITEFPTYLGGTCGNLDTEVILRTNGAVICKIGAEGLHGSTIATRHLGIAIKVLDGNSRALGPTLVSLLRRFVALPSIARADLEDIAIRDVRNAAGTSVGSVRARSLP